MENNIYVMIMEEKELKIKIEEQLKSLKELINIGADCKEIKANQRVLNELLREYLKEK